MFEIFVFQICHFKTIWVVIEFDFFWQVLVIQITIRVLFMHMTLFFQIS